MNIVAFEIDAWEHDAFAALADGHDVELTRQPLTVDTAEQHRGAQIVSAFINSDLSAGVLDRFDDLRLIATRSTGFDHVDAGHCRDRGITVCNVPTYGENTVAEHVFGLLLTISHRLEEAIDRTRKGDFSPAGLQGFDLKGRTLGVIGTGNIGRADIGIAMGRRGTDAAKQVADMVLTDDAFETIVTAVRYGRIIFANIRRSVMFMLCTNLAEVIAVGVASVAGWPIPLRPLQILYLNVLTDVLPALALGVGPGSGDEMDRSPRSPNEPVLTRLHWALVAGWGVVIAACVLSALLIGWGARGWDTPRAVTVAFMTLGFGKLWFVFNLRPVGSGVLRNPVTRNPWIWASIAVCAGLLLAAVYLPPLAAVLETEPLDPTNWAVALGLSLAPLVVGQVGLAAARLWRRGEGEDAGR